MRIKVKNFNSTSILILARYNLATKQNFQKILSVNNILYKSLYVVKKSTVLGFLNV